MVDKKRNTKLPSAAAGVGRGAAAARIAAARGKTAAPPPRVIKDGDRPALGEELDPTEPEDLERWLTGVLRDWQLRLFAKQLDQVNTVLNQLLSDAQSKRAVVTNDLRAEGYLDGQINVLETVMDHVGKAASARRNSIGKDLGPERSL